MTCCCCGKSTTKPPRAWASVMGKQLESCWHCNQSGAFDKFVNDYWEKINARMEDQAEPVPGPRTKQ